MVVVRSCYAVSASRTHARERARTAPIRARISWHAFRWFSSARGNGTNDRASFHSTHDALESPHSSRSLVTPPLTRVL